MSGRLTPERLEEIRRMQYWATENEAARIFQEAMIQALAHIEELEKENRIDRTGVDNLRASLYALEKQVLRYREALERIGRMAQADLEGRGGTVWFAYLGAVRDALEVEE